MRYTTCKITAALRRFRQSLIMAFIVCISANYGFSQTYPDQVPNSECYGNYQPPSNDMPAYLQWFDADLSDSRIMRIGDKEAFGVTNNRIRHNYSKDQVWNADGSLIKLSAQPAAILDGVTGEFLYWANIPGYGRWSHTDPTIIYGATSSTNALQQYSTVTNQRTNIKTFNEYDSIDFGYGEGNLSNDDRYIGLIGRNGNTRTAFVYDIPNDIIVGSMVLPSGDLDWFSVSQSGEYAVLCWRPDGTSNNEGLKSYDINMTNERHIVDTTPHGDLGYDAYGNEVFVGYGDEAQWNAGYSMYMTRLDGGGLTNLFPYVNGRGIWGGHVSTRNIDRPGWAYVSEQCCSSNPLAPREIFAIKLDESGTVERYAKHHSAPVSYYHETQLVPNQDGTKIVFASNWNDSNWTSQQYAPSFLLKVNQPTLMTPTVEQNETVEYPYCVEYFNIEVQSILTHQVDDMFDEFDVKIELENLSCGIYIEIKTYHDRVERKKIRL